MEQKETARKEPTNNSIDKWTDQASSLVDFLKAKIYDIFEDNIPIDEIKEVPDPFWRNSLGLFTCALVFGVFLYFVMSSYTQSRTTQFVSLQSGRYCNPVPKPFSGQFLASTDGYWQGQDKFSYNLALYSFTFSNMEVTKESFYRIISGVPELFQNINQQTSVNDLALNMINLQAQAIEYNHEGYIQTITFTPEPAYVYQRANTILSFSSVQNGVCPYQVQGHMDSSNANIVSTIINQTFQEYCKNTVSLSVLGLDSALIGNLNYNLYLDLNSIALALAINLGYRNISKMETIALIQQRLDYAEFDYEGIHYSVGQYFDPYHPGMEPIICLAPNATASPESSSEPAVVCFVRIYGYFFLPTSNAMGGSESYNPAIPQYCNCSTEVGTSASCNIMSFLTNLIFLEDPSQSTFPNYFESLLSMLNRYQQQYGSEYYHQLNIDSYTASYAAANAQTIPGSMDFCGFNCSMITLMTGDFDNYATSQFFYQLGNGSCTSSLFTTTNWERLASNPPVVLTESYVQCVDDPSTALFNAFGISSGNVSLALQAFVVLALPIIYFILKQNGVKLQSEFSKDDKFRASDDFAYALLKAAKYNKTGKYSNGTIVKIAEDMKMSTAAYVTEMEMINLFGGKMMIMRDTSLGNIDIGKLRDPHSMSSATQSLEAAIEEGRGNDDGATVGHSNPLHLRK